MDSELTVAICTKDRRDDLDRTMRSLASQQWSGAWDVLVVDNGSSDGTDDVARERSEDLPCPASVLAEPVPGLAHGRNRALREAAGRSIVFIDDDVDCDPGWVAAHGEAFRDDTVAGSGGPIRPLMPDDTPPWFLEILDEEIGGPTSRYEFGDEPGDIVDGGPIPCPFGANMGMLRERALEAGGFRTDLGWGTRMIPSEELEFFRRYRLLGGRIVYLPAASLVHRIQSRRTTWDYYLRWNRGYGRSLALMEPPRHAWDRARRVARQVKLFLRWRRRGRRSASEAEAIRRFASAEQARGELLEMLRL
ncbi:MAG: glycosyltransferase [Planctomycetota bacterium]